MEPPFGNTLDGTDVSSTDSLVHGRQANNLSPRSISALASVTKQPWRTLTLIPSFRTPTTTVLADLAEISTSITCPKLVAIYSRTRCSLTYFNVRQADASRVPSPAQHDAVFYGDGAPHGLFTVSAY
jgi:hypothetical protein